MENEKNSHEIGSKTKNQYKRKYDLLQQEAAVSLFKNHKTQFLFQLPAVLLFVVVVLAGFFGIQNSNKSLTTILIWVVWWSLLIISLAFAGRLWCFMCPFGAIGDWIQRRTFYKKVDDTFSLNRKFPAGFRNLFLAAMLFLMVTWADFQFNLVNSPLLTAYFIVALLALVVIISIIFKRRSFCRYVCPINGLMGLYSMFAPVELRVKEKETCKACKEKYCISGNENGYPCPVFEYPGAMEKNSNCILCTECVKTCHRNNISINLRSFAEDFLNLTKTRMDEAFFILLLLGVTIFQTLIMIRPWAVFTRDLMIYADASYDTVRFVLFIASAASPILVYSIVIAVSKSLNPKTSFKDLFTGYAYSVIPLVLLMHLSHNFRHLLEEGAGIIPVLSDPFGFGWDLFGTSGYMPAPFFDNDNILLTQWLLMFIGLGFSVSVGKNISKRVFHGNDSAFLPVLVFVIFFFVFNLWILGQPIMHKH